MKKVKVFDAADYLDNDEVIAEYLNAALEDANPDVFLAAISDVAKARGMSRLAKDAGEGHVHAPQRAQHAGLERRRARAQRVDHLVGALVALAPLADAAVDDLLQLIAAAQAADVVGAHAAARVSLHQHPEQLPHLVDVVARLPLGRRARQQIARRGHPVHRVRGDAARVALLADDAEVAELEARAGADEHVDGGEIAVQRLAAVQLAQHVEDAGDFTARRRLGPSLAATAQVGAEIAVLGVLEGEEVADAAVRTEQRERVEDPDRAIVAVEHLPEVGLAKPSVLAGADLQADDGGNR